MKTITYDEYIASKPNFTLDDVLEAQNVGSNVMVTVGDRLFCITDIDLNDEESFVCIDKECDEYTFSFTDIQSMETV
jgi:hypothetical protein